MSNIATQNDIRRLEKKIDRIDGKLDAATRAETSVSWLKWIVGGAWLAIAGLFATK